jgi:hypothetical protein
MEYLEGDTLASRLGEGPLPLRDVLVYRGKIAEALNRAHRQGSSTATSNRQHHADQRWPWYPDVVAQAWPHLFGVVAKQ